LTHVCAGASAGVRPSGRAKAFHDAKRHDLGGGSGELMDCQVGELDVQVPEPEPPGTASLVLAPGAPGPLQVAKLRAVDVPIRPDGAPRPQRCGCTANGVQCSHGRQDRTSQFAFDSRSGRRPASCSRGPWRVCERLRAATRCRGGREGPCRSASVLGRRRCLVQASGTGVRSAKASARNGQAFVQPLGARGDLAR